MVTFVEEVGDVKVRYNFGRNKDGLFLEPEAVFETPYHISENFDDVEVHGFFPQKEWDDCQDPSYTVSGVPILTLVVDYLDSEEGGRAIIIAWEDRKKVETLREAFSAFISSEKALDGIMTNRFTDFLRDYLEGCFDV